jgi:hypothetical protein
MGSPVRQPEGLGKHEDFGYKHDGAFVIPLKSGIFLRWSAFLRRFQPTLE